MKGTILLLLALFCMNISAQNNNPFFVEWNTPFHTPPFNEIKTEHFLPAIEHGIKLEKEEVDAITNNQEEPTFENTIVAYEKAGKFLSRVNRVFGSLRGTMTNDELQAVARETTPLLSKHGDDISLNPMLFERIKKVYDKRESLNLSVEENRLLENQYSGFVRSGANLSEEKKSELRKINDELSMLGLNFGENHLKETNAIALVIENKDDLVGLSDDIIQGALEMGAAKGQEGKYVFTLQKPSWIPFLTYSPKRELREIVYKAYINRGNNNNANDNKEIVSKIEALRVKQANLLGYKTYADYVLEKNMAKNAKNVYKFLDDIWTPAVAKAKEEIKDMQAIIDAEGGNFKLAAWDWWYYAEKVKVDKYALDEESLRPYFKMENVRAGAFDVANKLYGITFEERNDIQVYHPDVTVFEVKEADGTHLGVFYSDYYPRESKRSGAWSSSFRSQSNMDGEYITPLVYNVGNFAKPVGDKPSLMSIDEVTTLFHELGHGLHSLFSNTTYQGSRWVPRDFVELPSQVMENWSMEPSVLKSYAKHYETGEVIPDALIEKMVNAGHFNQGFVTVEYIAASYLDMDWQMLTEATEVPVPELEKACFGKIGLMDEIAPRYLSTNFGHIIGGYAAGYYSYLWAAVLDSDAFMAFKETELFNPELAKLFREKVLARGGVEDPMEQYIMFRGREPKVDALLEKRGLK